MKLQYNLKKGGKIMMKLKSALKKVAMIIASATVISLSIVNVSAINAFYTIDNDTIDSSYGNINNGFTYLKNVSSLYNSDARITASKNTSNSYSWTYPASGQYGNTNLTVTVRAYLNYTNFTDPTARYTVQKSQYVDDVVGYINQNRASAGWNNIGTKTMSSTYAGGGFVSSRVTVTPSGTSGCYTGADGIIVIY